MIIDDKEVKPIKQSNMVLGESISRFELPEKVVVEVLNVRFPEASSFRFIDWLFVENSISDSAVSIFWVNTFENSLLEVPKEKVLLTPGVSVPLMVTVVDPPLVGS